jgi:hypothetical protein
MAVGSCARRSRAASQSQALIPGKDGAMMIGGIDGYRFWACDSAAPHAVRCRTDRRVNDVAGRPRVVAVEDSSSTTRPLWGMLARVGAAHPAVVRLRPAGFGAVRPVSNVL